MTGDNLLRKEKNINLKAKLSQLFMEGRMTELEKDAWGMRCSDEVNEAMGRKNGERNDSYKNQNERKVIAKNVLKGVRHG